MKSTLGYITVESHELLAANRSGYGHKNQPGGPWGESNFLRPLGDISVLAPLSMKLGLSEVCTERLLWDENTR